MRANKQSNRAAGLSILIPSRNEIFLSLTVANILDNIEGDTEVIIVHDGAKAGPPVPRDPRVIEVELPLPIGQRAATNLAARLSSAKYVMKADAHCAFGPGFDRIMMEDIQPDWTMTPMMYNLHAFDWVCPCGFRRYQGPTGPCDECGCHGMGREIIWRPKRSPESTAMYFDSDLKFGYWSGYKKRQEGELVETMSLLGACWMIARARYFELDICDEGHGGWGQQGTEVACKSWLSGGKLICSKRTWFAHMFRTQGGDFGFPYPIKQKTVDVARAHSRRLFVDGHWSGAKKPLSWLVERFAPVPGWDVPVAPNWASKGIVYYTDNRLDKSIFFAVQAQLAKVQNGCDLVTVSLEPTLFGKNVTLLGHERGYLTMFRQILAGLERSTADVIFLCEHDVLYDASHFDFIPPTEDGFYYNQNRWQVDAKTGDALFYYASSTSGLCAYRELLLEHYRKRVELVEAQGFSYKMGFEPGTHNRAERIDDRKADTWMSAFPNVDLRHNQNLTKTRWHKADFRNKRYTKGWTKADEVPGWGQTKGRMEQLLAGLNQSTGALING